MSVTWTKVRRDLLLSRARTLMVVVSVAVGVFAVGFVLGLSDVMRARMAADHAATAPAHLEYVGGPFGLEAVDAVLREKGVADVLAETRAALRWLPPGESEWRNATLIAREAGVPQTTNRLDVVSGRWPAEGELALERQTARFFGLEQGREVLLRLGRRERTVPVAGVLRWPAVVPPQFGGEATFYATPEMAEWLVGLTEPNRLFVRLDARGAADVDATAEAIAERLRRVGADVQGYIASDPTVHPLQSTVDTLAVILGVLGVLSLGLSGLLVVNTMRALVAQQVWQIGVMKALGATRRRVGRIYLGSALLYGLAAFVLAAPLSVVATWALARILLDMLNVGPGPLYVPLQALAAQGLVGLLAPMLAALGPARGAARITAREALSQYGLGGAYGRGLLDRVVVHVRALPRPLALSLRNALRRKTRMVLTLLTLIIAGVMFVMVFSVSASLDTTLEVFVRDLGLDVWAVFGEPQRIPRLLEVAEGVEGVQGAEVWTQFPARLTLAGGTQRELYLMGLPPESALFRPRLAAGRNLLPADGNALLLNSRIAQEEGLGVGDTLEITLGGRITRWTVVGLVVNVSEGQRSCFVPLDALTRELGLLGRGTVVMISAHTGGEDLIRALRGAYAARGLEPAMVLSAEQVREQTRAQFNIILYLLLAMSALAAVVGGLGLMGTMSINVLERGREIGVMRAIGASSPTILGLVVTEGLLAGLLSWVIAVPLAHPAARLFSAVVGDTLLQVPLDYHFSEAGAVAWLFAVLGLATLASYWPARRAARLRVAETLRFE